MSQGGCYSDNTHCYSHSESRRVYSDNMHSYSHMSATGLPLQLLLACILIPLLLRCYNCYSLPRPGRIYCAYVTLLRL